MTPITPESLSHKPIREEWGVQWAMGISSRGYFARVAYRGINDVDFYKPLGDKIELTAEQFEAISCPGEWQPAETMPDWAVRKWEPDITTQLATVLRGRE